MESFVSDISDIYWWISVVIVGLIINICASFIKQRLDNSLNSFSVKRKKKAEQEKQKVIEEVNELSKSEFQMVMKSLQEFRHRFLVLSFLILAMTLILIAIGIISISQIAMTNEIIPYIFAVTFLTFGGVSILLALDIHKSTMKHRDILFKALEIKEES